MSRHAASLAPALAALILSLASYAAVADEASPIGIRAPEGFEVTLYAADDLAHDIYSMTLDPQGRVVVAGRDYVKTLHDDDGDGRAERATLYSAVPKSGAHGMLFVGNDLLATGDDSLMLQRDADADGQADGEPEVWARLRHPEHGANGLVRGPDGWIYLICGNDAGVTETLAATPHSPVKMPQSGAVVRFSPDGKQSEIVAHGFRNPYDLDFNAAGQLFTVDADGERDHHLPWYAPTRLFDVAQGRHHGWVLSGWQRSWNRPAYFADNVERVVEIGRGSPTGLTVYRHTAFPARYRGSVLSCCWTLGRVYHLPLTPAGSTVTSPAQAEVFLETTGEVGFAPVDIAVGRQGELYVAIGGRRTRGSVFCVRYTGEANSEQPENVQLAGELAQVLDAPQPLSAWSRNEWEPAARKLGRELIVAAALTAPANTAGQASSGTSGTQRRVRAIEIVTELFGGLSVHEAEALLASGESAVAARAIWSLSRQSPDGDALKLLVAATRHEALPVQRAAWEALAVWPDLNGTVAALVAEANWEAAFASADRRIQAAALAADAQRDIEVEATTSADLWRLFARGQLSDQHAPAAAELLLASQTSDERLAAVRLLELALGDIDAQPMRADVYAGYTLRAAPEAVARLAADYGTQLARLFPADNDRAEAAPVNLELARLLAMLGVEDAALVERMAALCTADSAPADDVHYLICLSRLPGERSELATRRIATALAGVQPKMERQALYVSRNWPARVGEALAALVARDASLPAALVADEQFKLPAQALLAQHLPREAQPAAARKLIAALEQSEGELRWSEELVRLAATLDDAEAFAPLRRAWDDFAVRDAIAAVLARAPAAEDRPRFLQALSSVQADTVERAAKALVSLGGDAADDDWLAALAALKQASYTPEHRALRQTLAALLAAWSGQTIEIDDPGKAEGKTDIAAAYQPWFDWFSASHPALAARLRSLGTVDASAWQERLAKLDPAAGDIARGQLVFDRKACQKCHAGNSPLGPDLAGAAGRLSTADLLTAIVDPGKDVSPLYQTTQVVTGSGRVVTGLIVYESPDSTLVQTGPDNTVRVAGDAIVAMRKSRVSLMPAGLLNDATDQELADLLAYLKTIKISR
jgi:putative membrane-bound dehydrogenase-like protein